MSADRVHGPGWQVSDPTGTVRGRLHRQASLRGDAPFLVRAEAGRPPVPISYGEMDVLAGRTASVLASLGVGRGDAVHVHLRNSWELVAVLLGCGQLGAVMVPTNPSAAVDEVAFIASQSGCRVSVAAADLVAVVLAAQEMSPELEHVLAVGGADEGEGVLDFDAALAAAEPRTAHAGAASADVAAVLYTSGTTGWPKGVMLTNANLLFAGEAVGSHVGMGPDDRWLVSLPLFHMNALGYSLMSALCAGASAAVVERMAPESFGAVAAASGATLASLFAVHVRRILACPRGARDDENRLRLVLYAQQVSAQERSAFDERFATRLVQVYGLTETLAPTLSEPVAGPAADGTLGRPTPWSQVRIVDGDGREVGPGDQGELEVHGTAGLSLAAGYLEHPELMATTLHEGWLRTGDRMLVDRDGRYVFLGRRHDVVKPDVHNVSTAEVERVLLEHVSVHDVAVVGVADPAGDEAICAFVVLRPGDDATEEELRTWAGERLAPYKVPARIVLMEELPRSPVGKVLKGALRATVQLIG